MDANATDAHQQVEGIYNLISEKIFTAEGLLDPARYDEMYQLFEDAWQKENEKYEPYEGALETYKVRKEGGPTVAERGADLVALGEFRKNYIFAVRDFHAQVVTIEDYLKERGAQQTPAPGSGHGPG